MTRRNNPRERSFDILVASLVFQRLIESQYSDILLFLFVIDERPLVARKLQRRLSD
jgi:hypothetical protein